MRRGCARASCRCILVCSRTVNGAREVHVYIIDYRTRRVCGRDTLYLYAVRN